MNQGTKSGMNRVQLGANSLALGGLVFLALAPLYAAYESAQFWIALAGGVVLGSLLATLGAIYRWAILLVAALTVVVYFVFGAVVVMREEALFGVLPTLDVLMTLAIGSVQVWKQILTLQAPFTGFDHLMIAPYTAGLIGSVTSVTIGLRVRRHYALALLPAGALLIFAIAFSTYAAFVPGAIGGLFGLLALGWVVWRTALCRAGLMRAADGEQETSHPATRRAVAIGAAVTLGAAAVFGGATATVAAGNDRDVLRDHIVPPLELHDYASPLTYFRKYVRDGEDDALFTVSGVPSGTSIRLAALDQYNGVVYEVSGSGGPGSGMFTRIGREIETDAAGQPASVSVEVSDLGGVWLPTVGYLTSFTAGGDSPAAWSEAVHYNAASGTGVVTTGLTAGDTYSFDTIVPTKPSDEDLAKATLATVTTPSPAVVPAEVAGVIDTIVGPAVTPVEQIRAVEAWFQTTGYFSHGLEGEVSSRSGHSSARESDLLDATQMIGDDEQYAVAMALMLSQLGYPVRVVMGFTPEGAGDSFTVTGDDLHAWVEVPFNDLGWVSFFPTPAEDRVPQERVPEERQKPRVQVAQPPDIPQEPAELPPAPPVEEASATDQPLDLSWLWATLGIAGVVLAVLAVLLGPSLALAVARLRRRKKRAHAESAVDRMDGGWAEIVDSAVDVGADLSPGSTRREQAHALNETYPEAGVTVLARRADIAVFGAGEPSTADVEEYWADVDTAVKRIGSAVPWHRRLRAALFPASVIGSLVRWRPRRKKNDT